MQGETRVDLDRLFAFERWASEQGMTMDSEGDGRFVDVATQRAWEGYQAGTVQAARKASGVRLLARIRSSSKYAHQANWMIEGKQPYPFPLALCASADGYVVKGGVGGCYRLEDVDLIAVVDGAEFQLTGRRKRK